MTPRILAQLGALAIAESNALREDPDGKIKVKDGWREFQQDHSRPLTVVERKEAERFSVLASRCFYAARAKGFLCFCEECVFGDPEACLHVDAIEVA